MTITAIVEGASNQLVAGVPVTFQASSGGIAATQTVAGKAANVAAGTTDATGTAQAILTTPANAANRVITVTASAGSASNTIQVNVVGTSLSVSGPSNLVQSDTGNYSVSLFDSSGNAIANQTVALTSALGNTLTPTSVTTNSSGNATFTMAAANSGSDTIMGTWQTASGSQKVAISNQNFAFTAPLTTTPVTNVNIGSTQPVTIAWSKAGTPQNGTVQFTTDRGTLSTQSVAVTNGVLNAPVTISSTTAGQAIIAATALDSSNKVVATAQTTIEFVATNPTAVSVQASPSTVPIKGQSTLTATVTDPTGNPVAGVTVNFNLTDTTGGQLSSPGYATTNLNGLATVTYTASTVASAANGVVVQATVANTSVTNSVALTVGGQTVFLSLGTGNLLTPYSTTQYELPYTVQAVDSAGNGVSGVNVVFKVESTAYFTGELGYDGSLWVSVTPPGKTTSPTAVYSPACTPTTVVEYNGVINPSPIPAGVTPVNTNIPGSIAATDNSTVQTGTAGSAAVNIIYPKDHAYWVQVVLTATATVSGTQSTTAATFILPGLASDYQSPTIVPPGEFSPYGTTGACW